MVARLVQLLQPIAARWFEVGALLGLPLGESLTSIRHDPSLGSDTARLRRVLEEWLLHAERWGLEVPSWQVLVDVLAHGTGGDDPGLAQTLAQHSLCADGTVTSKDLLFSSVHMHLWLTINFALSIITFLTTYEWHHRPVASTSRVVRPNPHPLDHILYLLHSRI